MRLFDRCCDHGHQFELLSARFANDPSAARTSARARGLRADSHLGRSAHQLPVKAFDFVPMLEAPFLQLSSFRK